MAIDSMLYQVSFAAGTYAAGTKGSLALVRGPSVVRDGCGTPRLVKVFTVASDSGLVTNVHIKNSQWNDEIINPAAPTTVTSFSSTSHGMQNGGNLELTKNSGFDITYEIMEAATTTKAVDVFCMIDIEYDALPAVVDPEKQAGQPMTIEMVESITATAPGAAITFQSMNVDIFKAGYRYLLTDAYFHSYDPNNTLAQIGFISITNAAGQGGLERIIPVIPSITGGVGFRLDRSTPLSKGPMNINLAVIASATASADIHLDFLRA